MAFRAMEELLLELRDKSSTIPESIHEDQNGNESNINEDESDVESIITNFSESDQDIDDEVDLGLDVQNQEVNVDLNTGWTDQVYNIPVDDFTEVSGQIHDLPQNANPIDYFKLFIPDSLITKIMYIKKKRIFYLNGHLCSEIKRYS